MTKNNVKNEPKIYTRISLLEREIIYKPHLEKKSQTEILKIIPIIVLNQALNLKARLRKPI
jgi:hypothetical protein